MWPQHVCAHSSTPGTTQFRFFFNWVLSGLKLKLPGGTLVTTPTAAEASVFAHF